jgi:hypothetical protein
MWKESDEKIIVRASTKERPGEYCITNAAVWMNV